MERYGFWNFVLDFFMTFITGGLWLFWIIFREIRKSNRANARPTVTRRYYFYDE